MTAEGFLAGRAGVATYVSPQIPAGQRPARRPAPENGVRPRPVWHTEPELPDLSTTSCRYDFRPGVPDARKFPFATWRALVADTLRERAVGDGAYGDPAGYAPLRAAIARQVAVSRGVAVTPEEVLVTKIYQDRWDQLMSRLEQELADRSSEAGMHLTARLLDQAGDDTAIVDRAARAGVGLLPLSLFGFTEPRARGLVLGYGAIPRELIDEGVRQLREAFTQDAVT